MMSIRGRFALVSLVSVTLARGHAGVHILTERLKPEPRRRLAVKLRRQGSHATLGFLLRRMRHKSDFPAMSESVTRAIPKSMTFGTARPSISTTRMAAVASRPWLRA